MTPPVVPLHKVPVNHIFIFAKRDPFGSLIHNWRCMHAARNDDYTSLWQSCSSESHGTVPSDTPVIWVQPERHSLFPAWEEAVRDGLAKPGLPYSNLYTTPGDPS